MGDSSLMTWISAVPFFILLVSSVAVVVAWRSGRRAIRTGVAILLIAAGVAMILFPVGLLSSLAGGTVIVLWGVALLIAEYRPGSAA